MDIQELKKLVEVACACMRKELPYETTHAVLQLLYSLTINYSVALGFLNARGFICASFLANGVVVCF